MADEWIALRVSRCLIPCAQAQWGFSLSGRTGHKLLQNYFNTCLLRVCCVGACGCASMPWPRRSWHGLPAVASYTLLALLSIFIFTYDHQSLVSTHHFSRAACIFLHWLISIFPSSFFSSKSLIQRSRGCFLSSSLSFSSHPSISELKSCNHSLVCWTQLCLTFSSATLFPASLVCDACPDIFLPPSLFFYTLWSQLALLRFCSLFHSLTLTLSVLW